MSRIESDVEILKVVTSVGLHNLIEMGSQLTDNPGVTWPHFLAEAQSDPHFSAGFLKIVRTSLLALCERAIELGRTQVKRPEGLQ